MVDLMNETPDVSTPRLEMKDIYREVTTARQALRDSYQNLQNVADYCEKNYMEAPDKRKALESTMSLVTQTLASVACQVGVAARHMSDMLEVQSLILQKEEAKVRYVSQDSDSQLSRTGTMSRKSVKNMGQAHNSMGRSSRVREPVIPPIIPAQMVPCPTSPDTTSPSFPCPTRMNGDFSLPPPERPASWTQQSLETDVQFPDLPPPPESAENGSLWLPMPTIEDVPMSNCKSLESIDECFPPPPAVDNEEHSLWPTGNGFPPPACTEQSADDLPPPPAPEYEMIHTFWPGENADTMDGSTSLDDLPPPPPPSDF
ncbi:ABI gene family member 3 isoform X2 [Eleutherodactylus coqui]|uniref:ABI gene family member 3 isoform X2 n=1 Tax=Eleutherodactylus coqui TaxID=57060 RepID=UPI0034631A1F